MMEALNDLGQDINKLVAQKENRIAVQQGFIRK